LTQSGEGDGKGGQSKGGGIQKEKGKAPERVSTQGLF